MSFKDPFALPSWHDTIHKHLTATEITEQKKQAYAEMLQAYNTKINEIMNKSLWDTLLPMAYVGNGAIADIAGAIVNIEKGIKAQHLPIPNHYHDALMEIIIAQIGLVLAKNNKDFDSFAFAERIRTSRAARRGGDHTGR